MKVYEKPSVNIVRFENESNNMLLASGNYNKMNFVKSNSFNEISY